MEVTKVAIVDITEAAEEVEEVDTRNTIVKMTKKIMVQATHPMVMV